MASTTLRTLAFAAACLASAAASAAPPSDLPDGPSFTPDEMARGTDMSARDCAAYRSTVHVRVEGLSVCFRYYLSNAGGERAEAVYFMNGDRGRENLGYDPERIDEFARRMSTGYHRPAVILARMGIDGSSGSHRLRRTWLEVEATNRAIDAINARHGFKRIHIMGQSGGGHLAGSLVGLRGDLGCVVPGSARLAFDEAYHEEQLRRPPPLRHYSPDTALPTIARQSAKTRILVVTDPRDQRVPAPMQTAFVDEVRSAGGRASQFFVTASDANNHDTVPHIRVVMAGCLLERTDAQIEAGLHRFAATRLEGKGETKPAPRKQAEMVPPPAGAR